MQWMIISFMYRGIGSKMRGRPAASSIRIAGATSSSAKIQILGVGPKSALLRPYPCPASDLTLQGVGFIGGRDIQEEQLETVRLYAHARTRCRKGVQRVSSSNVPDPTAGASAHAEVRRQAHVCRVGGRHPSRSWSKGGRVSARRGSG